MFVNLTPHPMAVYPPDTPDSMNPGSINPTPVIPASPFTRQPGSATAS